MPNTWKTRLSAVVMTAAAGAVAASGVLTTPTAARAETAAPPIDTAALLQGGDFLGIDGGDRFDTAYVHRVGGQDLSYCSNAKKMSDITAGGPKGDYPDLGVQWVSQRDPDGLLTESASDGGSSAWTARFVKRLNATIVAKGANCDVSAAHSLKTSEGSGTWYVMTDGAGHRIGGVAVVRNGTRFAIVQVTNMPIESRPLIKKLTAAAIDRLDES